MHRRQKNHFQAERLRLELELAEQRMRITFPFSDRLVGKTTAALGHLGISSHANKFPSHSYADPHSVRLAAQHD